MIYSTSSIERIKGCEIESTSFHSVTVFEKHVSMFMISNRRLIPVTVLMIDLNYPVSDVVGFWESYDRVQINMRANDKMIDYIQNHKEECYIYYGRYTTSVLSPSDSFLDSFETMLKLGYFDE